MTRKEIAKKYLEFLARGTLHNILALFSEEAIIHSPIYGIKRANAFYRTLGEDTALSALKLNGIFEEENTNRLALYFNYKWTLKNKKQLVFDVVDILKFDEGNKITELKIIYDTVSARALIEELKK